MTEKSDTASPMKTGPDWRKRLALALVVGTVGGLVAWWLNVPLAWMLGPMAATLLASLRQMPIAVPMKLRTFFIGALGLYLGSTFTPDLTDRAGEWPISLAGVLLFVPVVTILTAGFYVLVSRYDGVTALFSATPGALTPMVIMGTAAGGHEQKIALTQGLRVMLVVFAAPMLVTFLGYEAVAPDPAASDPVLISLKDFALLVVACIAGGFIGKKLHFPAAEMSGAMVASGALYIAGIVEGALPDALVGAILLVLGTAIGSRFAGIDRRLLIKLSGFTLVSVALIMVYTALAAWGLSEIGGLEFMPVLLALAPGGVAEMCLVAVALGIDPGFVAFHHIARITVILTVSPLVGKYLMHRRQQRETAG